MEQAFFDFWGNAVGKRKVWKRSFRLIPQAEFISAEENTECQAKRWHECVCTSVKEWMKIGGFSDRSGSDSRGQVRALLLPFFMKK